MPVTIFSKENGNSEQWLLVNDDGTLTLHVEAAGWVAVRGGVMPRDENISVEDAKRRWPQHAAKIDAALSEIQAKKSAVPKFNDEAVERALRNHPERSSRE